MLSFANPIDDMAALKEVSKTTSFGNLFKLIDCPSCVKELKINK